MANVIDLDAVRFMRRCEYADFQSVRAVLQRTLDLLVDGRPRAEVRASLADALDMLDAGQSSE